MFHAAKKFCSFINVIGCCFLLRRRSAARMINKLKYGRRERILLLVLLVLVLAVIVLVVGLAVGLTTRTSSKDTGTATCISLSTSGHDSVYKRYRFTAATTDTNICSQIGVSVHFLYFAKLIY